MDGGTRNENMSLWNSSLSGSEWGNGSYSGWSGGALCEPGLAGIIVPVIFSIVILFGIIGNTLVIWVVMTKTRAQYRTTTNIFISNLAISDLLFLVFCVPFHAVIYSYCEWPFGEFMCKFVHFWQYSSMMGSIFTLVAMSLDRYLAVAHPLHTKHLRTPGTALGVILFVWLMAMAMSMPWPILYTTREYTFKPPPQLLASNSTSVPDLELSDELFPKMTVCADDWGSARNHRATYFLVLFIISYALPLVIIIVMSTLMIYQLWLIDWSGGPAFTESMRAKRKVTRLVIVVVSVFFICWFPSHLCWLWVNYFRSSWRPTEGFLAFKITAHVLSYANSCMNPIIYAFMSANFRKGFYQALRFAAGRVTPWFEAGSKTVHNLCQLEEPHTQTVAL